MSYLTVEKLAHAYGSIKVLHDISFGVGQGERLCLLGPSGCGKTTTLQILAGFVQQADGTVRIDGEAIDRLPPEKRNVGIMFQNYALFPHMTVFDNVAYGLKMRHVPRDEIRQRVTEALQLVKLAHAAAKLPSQLSGGEQQRIAFARAIVIKPRLLLLDEPFSNLDARLRVEMRGELLSLLESLDIATLMVTHDQEEAMAIADRIAVMQGGRIEQIGSTHEIYEKPASLFVGRFIGESNTFPAKIAGTEAGRSLFDVKGLGRLRASSAAGGFPADSWEAGRGAGSVSVLGCSCDLRRPSSLVSRSSWRHCSDVRVNATRLRMVGPRTKIRAKRMASGSMMCLERTLPTCS